MIILSNGFPTNMPNAEEISQGGPANFARLFYTHMISATQHKWIGVMFHGTKSKGTRLNKAFSLPQRDFYKLYFPKSIFRKITQAKAKQNTDPNKILQKQITRIAKLIQQQKPNVVFLNGFGIFNWVLLKAAEKTGTPTVIQHAGIWTKELRLHKSRYSKSGLKIMEKMEKDSTRLTSAEVFLNTWSRDYYKKHVSKKADKGIVIPLPFDFVSFATPVAGQNKTYSTNSKTTFRIGTIARWDKIKNHNAILSLAKSAARKGLNWHFYSVTKIPDSKRPNRKENSYKKNITTIKALNRAEISGFCRSMNLLILPSLFDVSPTVVLEAIASETPIVISTNVGYVHEFKKFGAKDWIIDPKNISKTLTRIKKIADKSMPELLRKQIIENHDYRKVFASYLDLFQSIAQKPEVTLLKKMPRYNLEMISIQ